MKKLFSVLLVLCFLCTSCMGISASAACSPSHYSDVSVSASYYDAVCYLYDHGIMTGTGNGKFSPGGLVTRAQIVTTLWNMMDKPTPVGTVSSFSDCSSGAYYYDAVRWASSSGVGIVMGYEDGTFHPSRNVSQQEAFTFLYRTMCYCKYVYKTTTNEDIYRDILANSNLTYRDSVSTYAKPAFGWAYSIGLTLSVSVVPKNPSIRSNIAQYVYRIYQKYQKKYGLTVVCTHNLPDATKCGNAMATLFKHHNATCVSKVDIAKSEFSSVMSTSFTRAKPLDICYIFLHAHGGSTGVGLWPSGGTLSPETLRTEILKYKGKFVVMISSCYSGGYISQSVDDVAESIIPEENTNTGISSDIANSDDGMLSFDENISNDVSMIEDSSPVENDTFDPEWFARILVGLDDEQNQNVVSTQSTDLRGTNRIRVLCDSKHTELSYDTPKRSVKFWCLGAGYDFENNVFTNLAADTNWDNRISLEELYKYSYDQILQIAGNDTVHHVVRYPLYDSSIIFETDY